MCRTNEYTRQLELELRDVKVVVHFEQCEAVKYRALQPGQYALTVPVNADGVVVAHASVAPAILNASFMDVHFPLITQALEVFNA
jgi:hypothetical protein